MTERFLDDLRKHLRKILNLTNRKLQKFITSAFKEINLTSKLIFKFDITIVSKYLKGIQSVQMFLELRKIKTLKILSCRALALYMVKKSLNANHLKAMLYYYCRSAGILESTLYEKNAQKSSSFENF